MTLDTLPQEWTIRQSGFDPDNAGVYETLFTVGNGRLATRGAHEEGHRGAQPGSYVSGVFDGHDSIVIDLVNCPGWIDTAVTVAGVRLDADTCTVLSHERALDISRGVLHRSTVFEDSQGRRTQVESRRTASMANRDIAVAQYERAIQSAFREVADALAGRATLGDQLNAQRKQLEAEQARSRLVELRWRNGAASSLELLDAQRSLFAAQQALLQLQAQSTQNLATLYKVLGGGWK